MHTELNNLEFEGDVLFDRMRDERPRLGAPRVALLTPYTGGNLGDAAIQDATIANLRLRLPDIWFSGISLNCDNFTLRHGSAAFPLCASNVPFYGMQHASSRMLGGRQEGASSTAQPIWQVAGKIPGLKRCLKAVGTGLARMWRELRHCVKGYRFLRGHDLLVVSGGGQLDEQWGGAWGHPFALLKWAVLARVARVPCAVASVGACKIESITSRLFLYLALHLASYRSYRDNTSRDIAANLLRQAARDSVVPDLAFSLLESELPPPAGIRSIAQGRTIIAISPMAFAKPGSWPYEDRALYNRYLQQMSQVVSQLLERGYFLISLWSAFPDRSVIPELLGRLGHEPRKRLAGQMYNPAITTWKDLVAVLQDVDFLIASRLHGAILGFVAQRPTVAISFDPKVDWVMEDLGQTDYLLQIRDFSAEAVIEALERLERRKDLVMEQIASYRHRALSISALQYDVLAELAMASRRRNN